MGIQAKATQAIAQLMSLNMLMWLTMLILFASVLYLAAAVYMALALVLPLAIAALVSGILLLGVSALLAGLIHAATRPKSDQASGKPAESRVDNERGHDPRASVSDRAIVLTRDNPEIVAAGALAAGIALAASPGLRHFAVRTAGPILVRKVTDTLQ